jgi:D-3-phosphoglycerate dehydrogenase
MTVLITEPDGYSERAISLYRETFGEVSLDQVPVDALESVKVLVVRLAHRLDESYLSRYPALQAIVSPTTGLTHINMNVCRERGIRVLSLAQCKEAIDAVTSTSELTLGLIISLLRKIPQANHEVVQQGRWDRDAFRSRQLSSLSLGIIGLGRIGGHVARYGKALDMSVLAYDPFQPDTRFNELRVCLERNIESMLPQVDILTIHAELTSENHHLIGREEISLLQPHALVVNTARGALLDESFAANALRSELLAGVAVDVLEDEHSGKTQLESPLLQAARDGFNIIVTPHVGGCTSDAMHITEERMAEVAVSELAHLS